MSEGKYKPIILWPDEDGQHVPVGYDERVVLFADPLPDKLTPCPMCGNPVMQNAYGGYECTVWEKNEYPCGYYAPSLAQHEAICEIMGQEVE